MESPICCAILGCGKSLSEMLAEPWTNIAVQPRRQLLINELVSANGFSEFPICLAST
jgi:hypothetical protein